MQVDLCMRVQFILQLWVYASDRVRLFCNKSVRQVRVKSKLGEISCTKTSDVHYLYVTFVFGYERYSGLVG